MHYGTEMNVSHFGLKGQGHGGMQYAGSSTFSFHNSSGRRHTILDNLVSSYIHLVLVLFSVCLSISWLFQKSFWNVECHCRPQCILLVGMLYHVCHCAAHCLSFLLDNYSILRTCRDDDDINDVATMGGVNLVEESRNILSANAGVMLGQLRSCKDESFLDNAPLASRISAVGLYWQSHLF